MISLCNIREEVEKIEDIGSMDGLVLGTEQIEDRVEE